MIPDDDEAEHVEDDAANLEAVLEPEEEGEGEAGEGEGEAAPADEEAPSAEEGGDAPAEGAEDAEGNLLLVHNKFFERTNQDFCEFRWR